MDALDRLKDLYTKRDNLTEQIYKIEVLLGAEPGEVKVRKPRGPNKKKDEPPKEKPTLVPPKLPTAVI
jgi:hypothetical protein